MICDISQVSKSKLVSCVVKEITQKLIVKKSVIIYLSSSCSKPVRVYFFVEHKRRYFKKGWR